MIKAYALAIALAALIATTAIYVGTAERARALVKQYESEASTYLQTLAQKDERIVELNTRIKANNAEWLALVQAEAERVQAAQAEAARIRQERDRVMAELIESRKAWREALADDEDLAEFVERDVPAPVWRRLCIAAGDASCG